MAVQDNLSDCRLRFQHFGQSWTFVPSASVPKHRDLPPLPCSQTDHIAQQGRQP